MRQVSLLVESGLGADALMSRDNELSFLPLNLARLASCATQLSSNRGQLSSACARMQATGQPGKQARLPLEQSSLAQAVPGHYPKRTKRSPRPPQLVNEDSSLQVSDLVRTICVVTGQLTCEETRFSETLTAGGLTQSSLWHRNAPPIGPTVRGHDLRSLIQSGPPRQDRQDSVRQDQVR